MRILLCIVVAAFALTLTATAAPPGPPVAEGRIIAFGAMTPAGCVLDFRVTTLQPPAAPPTWTYVTTDGLCHARLVSRGTDLPERLPRHLLGPSLLPADGGAVEESPRAAVREGDGASADPEGAASMAAGCKVSYQHVFMYGGGGPPDSLTHKNGRLEFCYDGNSAWINSQWGNCEGSSFAWWAWVVDGCWLDRTINGPDYALREGHGNYHCDPPTISPCNFSSGYYHSLYDSELGRWDGYTECSYRWSGTISHGVTYEYIQGCQ